MYDDMDFNKQEKRRDCEYQQHKQIADTIIAQFLAAKVCNKDNPYNRVIQIGEDFYHQLHGDSPHIAHKFFSKGFKVFGRNNTILIPAVEEYGMI